MDLSEALAWYVQLAGSPGWKEYAWHRVNEMARQCPSLYGELPALLTAAMNKGKERDERCSADAGSTESQVRQH